MMGNLFSVVIPTLGRKTLPKTLESINRNFADPIVVVDGFGLTNETEVWIRKVAKWYDTELAFVNVGYHDWGSPQLQEGYRLAKGDWIINCGDDDIYEPYAFHAMARAIEGLDAAPIMFRTVLHPSPVRGNTQPVVLWQHKKLVDKNITGQCIAIPNVKEKIGDWNIIVDFGFIVSTVVKWDNRVHWREEIISQCY